MSNDVLTTIRQFLRAGVALNGVIIGGLAVSYYGLPRLTFNIDVLVQGSEDVPEALVGFERISPLVFRHVQTKVELQYITPRSYGILPSLAAAVLRSAVESNSLKVATREGLIALKLLRLTPQDKNDIGELLECGPLDQTFPGLAGVDLEVYRLAD